MALSKTAISVSPGVLDPPSSKKRRFRFIQMRVCSFPLPAFRLPPPGPRWIGHLCDMLMEVRFFSVQREIRKVLGGVGRSYALESAFARLLRSIWAIPSPPKRGPAPMCESRRGVTEDGAAIGISRRLERRFRLEDMW